MQSIPFKYILILLIAGSFFACKDDEKVEPDPQYDYRVNIMSPSSDDKHLGDTMHIHVNFESGTGAVIHHINVTVQSWPAGEVIYTEPAEAHIHEHSGAFQWHDDLVLAHHNGVAGHTNWILVASAWGHEQGFEVVRDTVAFHVHPH